MRGIACAYSHEVTSDSRKKITPPDLSDFPALGSGQHPLTPSSALDSATNSCTDTRDAHESPELDSDSFEDPGVAPAAVARKY